MAWYLYCLRHYADFAGRASRTEYWTLYGVNCVAALAFGLLIPVLPFTGQLLSSVFGLATFVPSIAVAVRRLHDTSRSATWLVLPLLCVVGSFALGVAGGLLGEQGPGDPTAVVLLILAVLAMGAGSVIGLVSFYFFLQPGDPAPNPYGRCAPEHPLER